MVDESSEHYRAGLVRLTEPWAAQIEARLELLEKTVYVEPAPRYSPNVSRKGVLMELHGKPTHVGENGVVTLDAGLEAFLTVLEEIRDEMVLIRLALDDAIPDEKAPES